MSDQPFPQATLIPAQPAFLLIGDRRIPIDEWPLARAVEERRSVDVEQSSKDSFVIAPKKRAGAGILVQGITVFLAGVLPGIALVALEAFWWVAALLSLGVFGILALLVRSHLRGQRRVRFDRQTGELTVERRTGFRREFELELSYPLKSILAVQLLYNGRHTVTEPQGVGEQQTTSYREFSGYELNLVLDNPKESRRNLFSLADWGWVRHTGQAIGTFLGVTVIDHLHHGV